MFESDDPGTGTVTLLFRPHPGAFRQLMCPPPWGIFPIFFLNVNAQGLARGEGWGWALLEIVWETSYVF